MAAEGNTTHHELWNKGKIVGQKAPFKVHDIWRCVSGCRWKGGCEISRSSTWISTASFADAISSPSTSETSVRGTRLRRAHCHATQDPTPRAV